MFKKLTTLTLILAGTCAMAAGPVRINIHEDKANGVTIAPEIYGQFSEHLGSCIYGGLWVGPDSNIPNINGYRKDVFDALKTLKVPVMRWPGGCFADDYHWMDGVGPLEQRAKINNNNWGGTLENNSFGTHEFLNLCEMLGCEPYISGNVGSGTVEEMAKWIEYMTSDSHSTVAEMRRQNGREKPWKVKYFGIGNESWGCGGNMTAQYYSDVYRRYATYLRDYSGNQLYKIASGASDYDYNWTETMMKNAGSMMNGISLHYYSVRDWDHKGSATEFSDQEYYLILAKALGLEPVIARHCEIMDKYDPQKRVGLLLDEWGTWFDVEKGTNPGHLFQQSTMRDAMVAALSLNFIHKFTDRLRMANIAQVVNVLQAMILTRDEQMVLTPTYHVFRMYNVHQGAEYIPVDYICNSIQINSKESVPQLSATASRKDGVYHVDVVNPCLDEDMKVVLSFDSRTCSAKNVSAEILNAASVNDFNDFGKAAKVEPKAFKDFKVTKDGIEVTIPAHSIVAFEMR